MEITKKKYKQAEVIEIVQACECENQAKLKEQKDRIIELTKENSDLISKLETYKDKERLINLTLQRAEKNAQKLKEKAELQYLAEIERLRAFAKRWENYFSALKEKYPVYAPVDDAIDVKQRLATVLKLSNASKILDKLDKTLDEKHVNKADKKASDLQYSIGDNGFNLDEVLNPGELQLEDLCKELGLLDGEE